MNKRSFSLPRAGDIYLSDSERSIAAHDKSGSQKWNDVKYVYSKSLAPRGTLILVIKCIDYEWQSNGAGNYVLVEALIEGMNETLTWVFMTEKVNT